MYFIDNLCSEMFTSSVPKAIKHNLFDLKLVKNAILEL